MNIRIALHDRKTRRSLEDAIERLVALLDGFDPDPDLEPDNDAEPGTWPETPIARALDKGGDENLEEGEADEDGGDAEPSLGAPERHPHSIDTAAFNGLAVPRSGYHHHVSERSQERWADGLRGDHEREEENEHGGDILDEPHAMCGTTGNPDMIDAGMDTAPTE